MLGNRYKVFEQPKHRKKYMSTNQINKWMINPSDTIMLLIDHQSELLQLVRDIDQQILRELAR
jgi:hypothetical protein